MSGEFLGATHGRCRLVMGTWLTQRTSLVDKSKSPLGASPLVRESLRSAVRPAAYQTLSVMMVAFLREGTVLQEKAKAKGKVRQRQSQRPSQRQRQK